MVRDEMFDEAVRIVLETHRGSVSLLQRRLGIGYARASRIIEMMAASGILGEYKGSQAREVMMTVEEYERIREQMEADAGDEQESHLTEDEDSSQRPYKTPVLQRSGKMESHIIEGQRGYVSADSETD